MGSDESECNLSLLGRRSSTQEPLYLTLFRKEARVRDDQYATLTDTSRRPNRANSRDGGRDGRPVHRSRRDDLRLPSGTVSLLFTTSSRGEDGAHSRDGRRRRPCMSTGALSPPSVDLPFPRGRLRGIVIARGVHGDDCFATTSRTSAELGGTMPWAVVLARRGATTVACGVGVLALVIVYSEARARARA